MGVVQGANSGTSRTATDVITYDKATINTGEVLNLDTGVFTASQRGIYAFSISFFPRKKPTNTYFHGYIYKDRNLVYHLLDINSDDNGHNFAYFWMDSLEAGDTIKITGFKLDSGSGNLNVFSGFLL